MLNMKRALLLLTAVAALLVGLLPAVAGDDVLFVHLSNAAAGQEPSTGQAHHVQINWPALEGQQGRRIKINLFDGQELTAVRDRLDPSSSTSGYVWVGHVEGRPFSMVTLAVLQGVMSGSITWDGQEQYTIRYDGAAHVLRAVDHTAVIEVEGPDTIELSPPSRPLTTRHSNALCEDGSRIDLLVAYTPLAAQREGGRVAIEALINQRVSDMNSANINSGLNFRYRLVQTMLADYVESGDVRLDLPRLRSHGDGYLDDVLAARDASKADMVSLVIAEATTGYACGVGYVLNELALEYEANAFNVAAIDYAGAEYLCSPWTMAHEFGHNMGNRHERAIDAGTPVLPYAYAYKSPLESFRTIMAYNCAGGCPRINYWSNPDISFAGEATGRDHDLDPQNSADNARSMSETAVYVANFRQDCPVDPGATPGPTATAAAISATPQATPPAQAQGPYHAFFPISKAK